MVEYLCVVAPALVHWLEEELCHAYRNAIMFCVNFTFANLRIARGETVIKIPSKRTGRPLTLEEIDGDIQNYVKSLRATGTPMSVPVVLAAAEGIVRAMNRTLFLLSMVVVLTKSPLSPNAKLDLCYLYDIAAGPHEVFLKKFFPVRHRL